MIPLTFDRLSSGVNLMSIHTGGRRRAAAGGEGPASGNAALSADIQTAGPVRTGVQSVFMS